MPVMNGYDLTRAIRAHEQQHQQPSCTILGFTANAQPEEKQRCREAGMDDCLFKPISLTALNERLSQVSVRPAASFAAPAPFDMDSIIALTGNRTEMIEHLIAQLISSARDDRQELLGIIQGESRHAIHDIAHKIKGAARIINARAVLKLCEQLERACDENAAIEQIREHGQALQSAMIDLETALLDHQQTA